MSRLLIAGLARSGTTTLYSSLQSALAQQKQNYYYVYEPYLWAPEVFNDLFQKFTTEFMSTGAYHVDGIYAHCKSPLFLDQPHAIHDDFVLTSVFPKNRPNVLAKIIRGNGRLARYLDLVDDLKIVLIVRNPLDSINSVMGLFSYFGDEFHPSDKPRFLREIARKFGYSGMADVEENIAGLSGLWWRYMTEAALAVAADNPGRVLAIPYEAYRQAPGEYLRSVLAFCGLEHVDLPEQTFKRKAGPVTSQINLNEMHVHVLKPLNQTYWQDIVPRCEVLSGCDVVNLNRQTLARYENAQGTPLLEEVDPSRPILHLRKEIVDLRQNRDELLVKVAQEANIKRVNDVLSRYMIKRWSHDQYIAKTVKQLKRSRLLRYLGPFSRKVREDIDKIEKRVRIVHQPIDITCVVTSYNNVETLRQAVMSVLAQSRPVKTVVIADDGSTDGSRDLARELEREYESVTTIFREQNLGPGLNRHLALADAETKFITNLDGDDRFGLEKIEREAQALSTSLKSIAFSDIVLEHEDGRVTTLPTKAFAEFESGRDRIVALAKRQVTIPRDMLLSKHLYLMAGGYETSARMYEDWSLKLRLAHVCDDWRYAKTEGVYYNRHGAGLSAAGKCYHAYWLLYCVARNFSWLKDILDAKDLSEIVKMVSRSARALESGRHLEHLSSALNEGRIDLFDAELIFRDFLHHIPLKPDIEAIDDRFTLLGESLTRLREENHEIDDRVADAV